MLCKAVICYIIDVGSNLICSLEVGGIELTLASLDALAVIVADGIVKPRIGMVQGVEQDSMRHRPNIRSGSRELRVYQSVK